MAQPRTNISPPENKTPISSKEPTPNDQYLTSNLQPKVQLLSIADIRHAITEEQKVSLEKKLRSSNIELSLHSQPLPAQLTRETPLNPHIKDKQAEHANEAEKQKPSDTRGR